MCPQVALRAAGDDENPRVTTPGGYVWSLNTEAVLIEKPDDAPEAGS